jgi:hypothetical protein
MDPRAKAAPRGTAKGNSLPRFLLVEAAQVTVRSDPEWRSKYFHLAMRRERCSASADSRVDTEFLARPDVFHRVDPSFTTLERKMIAFRITSVKEIAGRAKLAFDIYIHRLRSGIGAMIAVLGGIDALVFTAGVGENSPEVRAAACDNLAFLGLKLDQGKNTQSPVDEDISAPDATVRVLVIHAQEDWMIARECWNLVRTATTSMGH